MLRGMQCSQWRAGSGEVEDRLDSYYGVSYRRQPSRPVFPARLLEHPTIGAAALMKPLQK